MRAQLIKYLSEIRASYWFIPSLMVVLSILLSIATVSLDHAVGVDIPEILPGVYSNQAAGARSLLATVAGSMITVAGVTFSLTLLAVSHSTGQFGPRLLTNFMRDRGNQITLGTFIATFIYCLSVLRTVISADESSSQHMGQAAEGFVPHISIFCALLLTLASVAVLIYFIHHIPESIRISHVLADVGRELLERCDTAFPKELGESQHDADALGIDDPGELLPDHFEELAGKMLNNQNGYIQAFDETGVMQTAVKYDLQIRIYSRPGDFVSEGEPLMAVSPESKLAEAAYELRSSFAFGGHRTATSNPLFLVDQLVEVAMRALSPGVNDPLTAINCIDWLQSCLIQIANRDPIDDYRFDSNKMLRFVAHGATFGDFTRSIFDQLRPYVAGDRNAAIHMMKMIGNVLKHCSRLERRQRLIEFADDLLAAAKHADMFAADVETLRRLREPMTEYAAKE